MWFVFAENLQRSIDHPHLVFSWCVWNVRMFELSQTISMSSFHVNPKTEKVSWVHLNHRIILTKSDYPHRSHWSELWLSVTAHVKFSSQIKKEKEKQHDCEWKNIQSTKATCQWNWTPSHAWLMGNGYTISADIFANNPCRKTSH